jgi:transposase-like protein
MDKQILSLYAKSMFTCDIVNIFDEMYGAVISAHPASQVTNAVIDQIIEW